MEFGSGKLVETLTYTSVNAEVLLCCFATAYHPTGKAVVHIQNILCKIASSPWPSRFIFKFNTRLNYER